MPKKLFGLNLDIDLKARLDVMAKAKYTNASHLTNQILAKAIDEFEAKIEEKKKEVIEKHVFTEEERIADWKFRKDMVAQGKMDPWFGDEYPHVPAPKDF